MANVVLLRAAVYQGLQWLSWFFRSFCSGFFQFPVADVPLPQVAVYPLGQAFEVFRNFSQVFFDYVSCRGPPSSHAGVGFPSFPETLLQFSFIYHWQMYFCRRLLSIYAVILFPHIPLAFLEFSQFPGGKCTPLLQVAVYPSLERPSQFFFSFSAGLLHFLANIALPRCEKLSQLFLSFLFSFR